MYLRRILWTGDKGERAKCKDGMYCGTYPDGDHKTILQLRKPIFLVVKFPEVEGPWLWVLIYQKIKIIPPFLNPNCCPILTTVKYLQWKRMSLYKRCFDITAGASKKTTRLSVNSTDTQIHFYKIYSDLQHTVSRVQGSMQTLSET